MPTTRLLHHIQSTLKPTRNTPTPLTMFTLKNVIVYGLMATAAVAATTAASVEEVEESSLSPGIERRKHEQMRSLDPHGRSNSFLSARDIN